MFKFGRKVLLIYLKDLRTEIRTLDNFVSTIIFGVMLIVIFSFSFQLAEVDVAQAFAAILWISVFFTSTLGLQRLFAVEKENDAIAALMLAVGDRGSIFIAKMLANLTGLLLLELVIVPLLWILIDVKVVEVKFGMLLGSLFLGSWGLAAVGTLINGISVQLSNARLLFPILLFPLLIPILIGVVQCTSAALNFTGGSMQGWIYLLLCFNLIYTVLPFVLFDVILEG